jgi:hypothetical protein
VTCVPVVLQEEEVPKTVTVCGSSGAVSYGDEQRGRVVYISQSNRIDIRVSRASPTQKPRYFLLKYEGMGFIFYMHMIMSLYHSYWLPTIDAAYSWMGETQRK